MQICKTLFLFLATVSLCFAQPATPSIQAPSVPQIHSPSITAPTMPSLQMSSIPNNATIKTTNSTSENDKNNAPIDLSSELTTSALETLNGLFSGSNETFSESALGSIEGFTSLGDLSSLLTNEIGTAEDATTIALLQEILTKLTELEEKIDSLEKNGENKNE